LAASQRQSFRRPEVAAALIGDQSLAGAIWAPPALSGRLGAHFGRQCLLAHFGPSSQPASRLSAKWGSARLSGPIAGRPTRLSRNQPELTGRQANATS